MKRPTPTSLKRWHQSHKAHFDSLGRIVVSSLRGLLVSAKIPFLDVTYRVKGEQSFLQKSKKKRYPDPIKDCSDILGIRIITYIESDVDRTSELLRNSFSVDDTRSLDKRALLDVDRIGYRSVHFIASLGAARSSLPENAAFAHSVFEVQIRTVLQHAWAEIEHDRNYKLPTSLPTELERRLFLVAGVLELADREFNTLAADIDQYSQSIIQRSNSGNWDIELNTPSLKVFCDSLANRLHLTKFELLANPGALDDLVPELRDFGIDRLNQLDILFTPDFLKNYDIHGITTNAFGFIRDAMMYADLEKYLNKAWKSRWSGFEAYGLDPLIRKYGSKVIHTLKSYGLDIISEMDLEPEANNE